MKKINNFYVKLRGGIACILAAAVGAVIGVLFINLVINSYKESDCNLMFINCTNEKDKVFFESKVYSVTVSDDGVDFLISKDDSISNISIKDHNEWKCVIYKNNKSE